MTLKPLRIFVSASDDIGDVRLAVLDLLAQLKRFFKTRGVELMPTRPGDGPAGGDLAWTLYGKDFGALPEDEFDRAYEAFKEKNTPKNQKSRVGKNDSPNVLRSRHAIESYVTAKSGSISDIEGLLMLRL